MHAVAEADQDVGLACLLRRLTRPLDGDSRRGAVVADGLPAQALTSQVLARVEWVTLGYILFRVTSDVERLPFPLAPVAAQGATALAESDDERDSWRWRVFSWCCRS